LEMTSLRKQSPARFAGHLELLWRAWREHG
jgi:hypothetical protein